MLYVGDQVRIWHNEEIDDEGNREWWASAPTCTVRKIIGPKICECASYNLYGGCDCANRPHPVPYYYIRVSLPEPHHQPTNDNHFRLCEIAGRPWQMRRGGDALMLVKRGPPTHRELFA